MDRAAGAGGLICLKGASFEAGGCVSRQLITRVAQGGLGVMMVAAIHGDHQLNGSMFPRQSPRLRGFLMSRWIVRRRFSHPHES